MSEISPHRSEQIKRAKARYRARHPERVRAAAQRDARRYYIKNRERILLANRLRKYGLTIEELEAMREAQQGCCVTCGTVLLIAAPRSHPDAENIDHCHITGTVRGLLCGACNRTLGMVRDSAERLRRLADYVERTALAQRRQDPRYQHPLSPVA